ncbi:hypothetical protein D3453_19215 [Salmonella enterica]|uniref:Uncharacterized protein n=1 Tax=Salmonella enterica TaxID=28901 RepID=A0A5U1S2F0_SALER|nr:hypothetical protein [Salmonella enterica]
MLSIRAIARAFFCSKVTGAPPFHDVNVIHLCYHAPVKLDDILCIRIPCRACFWRETNILI